MFWNFFVQIIHARVSENEFFEKKVWLIFLLVFFFHFKIC